ncbi:MAG: electron transport complex subunit RsxC [Candidatus Omnitrophota bacterium]
MTKINPKEIESFPVGGVHPEDYKFSAGRPIENLPHHQSVAIPVSQHIGKPATPIVQINDKVKVGQLIAKAEGLVSANVHSSVSGTVKKIDDVIDVSGYRKTAILIDVEGDDWMEAIDRSPDIKRDIFESKEGIIKKVQDSGIVGLGGATFPSHVKLMPPEGKTVEFLIINGAECEPYLTSDHRLMLEKGEEITIGTKILLKALGIHKAMIGIENNKPDAIQKLKNLTKDEKEIEIHALKTQYPQGGERQIVKALTNREIPPPPKGLPIDVGCAVFNVGTVFAIYEAVQKNKPLFERVVSVSGKSLKKPSNFLTRFGTTIGHLIEAAGGLPEDTGKILSGGPMMGRALSSLDIPVTKGISGIAIFKADESKREEIINCIRCAKCVSACPLGLEPYLLMALVENAKWDESEAEKVLNCCECGCCSFICPANRPLLDYLKLGKTTVANIHESRA